jgi:tetratricopeptide (TPR) repeat protein
VLRERGDADAERALDAAVAEVEAPAEPGPALALHLAARAEALALRSRWQDAEEHYRRAVELMPDDSVRRSWYVNLADLELRLNDEPRRRRALEAARGLARNDEISRRVNDLLKAFGGRAEITARPAPAETP